jgi:glucokinase
MFIYFIILFFSTTSLICSELFQVKTYVEEIPHNRECYLSGDLDGTESRIGIFEVNNDTSNLLISFHAKTDEINDFTESIKYIVQYMNSTYGITINHACFAASGIASKNKDYASVHGFFTIKSKKLLAKVPLKTAIIVNDLFVVGYGLNAINQNHIIHLYGDIPKKENKNDLRAIISAGAGIGSSTITWDSEVQHYITHPGEAGLLEFSPTNKLEYQLANHTKNFYGRKATYWANLASGSGITRMYSIFKLMNSYHDSLNLDKHDPAIILNNPQDELCKATTDLFFKLFGRFARNYVWTILPYGGLYITGSIPQNHSDLFTAHFASAYNDPRFYKELREIPVYLVTDPNVGLYGAVEFLRLELNKNNPAAQNQD